MTVTCVITLMRMADDKLIKELVEEFHALRLAVLGVAAAVLSKQVLDSMDWSNTQAAESVSDLMDRVASIYTTRDVGSRP